MSSRPLKIVQISDCHLGASAEDRLLGMNTDVSLDAVIAQVRQPVDLLVVSGDIASAGSPAAYQRAFQKLDGLAERMVWLPGNHDELDAMGRVGGAHMPFIVELGGWQIVLLNSRVPGKVGGSLKTAELARLAAELDVDKPALVFTHHHLLPIGSAWLDEQRIDNADLLLDFASQQSQIKAVACGHIHQQWQGQYRGLQLLSSPSSCIQFAPNSDDFALEDINPGFRWFTLEASGAFDSGVERVQGQTFHIDQNAQGYK